MNLRPVPDTEAAPLIACIFAMAEAQDRMRAKAPPPPQNLRGARVHPDPAKRRNSPQRVYGLTEAELPEWRWFMAHKNLTAIEAANVVLRSRRGSRP